MRDELVDGLSRVEAVDWGGAADELLGERAREGLAAAGRAA
ncbi:MAG TPA: hypothetical protein VFA44_06615 [Gaiellaceae bacterium]|nr:hypothetical protein [Gaiellaceae bacterium]HZT53057.1 hypothetical protein [Gaiellaceae bacterium]